MTTTTETKFNAGDKVRVKDSGYTDKPWIGVEGIVQGPGLFPESGQYEVKLTDPKNTGRAVGDVANLGGNLELIEAAKPALNVGDKVGVDMDNPDFTWHGTEGIVLEVRSPHSARVEVTKVGPNHTSTYGKPLKVGDVHTLTALTVIPSFTFKDIQVGDTIRRTQTFKSGATEVREGTVEKKASWYVSTDADSYILAYDTDGTNDTTLELLNRPEPEPVKAVWEDAKDGDVFKRVNKANGVSYLLRREEDWMFLYDNGSVATYGKVSHLLSPEAYTITKV